METQSISEYFELFECDFFLFFSLPSVIRFLITSVCVEGITCPLGLGINLP